jgi:hypothetical protein
MKLKIKEKNVFGIFEFEFQKVWKIIKNVIQVM